MQRMCEGKGISMKILSRFLCVVLLMTMVSFPQIRAHAETVTNATDSSKPVYVAFSLESTTADYNQYSVAVYNNSGQAVCDWEVTVQFAADPGFNAGWNGVSYDTSTKIMKIQTYGEASWNNATIYNGQTGSGAGFQVDAGVLDSATVTLTYSFGESAEGPATGDDEESGGGGTSTSDTETNKDLNVEFNYAKLLQQSLYFYDANMCGDLEGTCGVSWRGNCHTYDNKATYSADGVTYSVDVSGGFHDAGDHVKFGLPQGYAASVLGMSYYQFKDAFTQLKQDTHMKTITDYFCDYFKRCTVYKQGSSDEVIAFCYQVGNGDTDHAIWTAPESQTLERPAYFADASNPATDQVSLAIAALALNYINFGDEADLKAAKDLFAFVQKNNLECATKGCQTYYNSTSYGDDYATAAAALYVATGKTNQTYLNVYNTYKDANSNGINEYWVMDWANSGALAAMLMGETTKLSNITKAGQSGTKLDNVFWCLSDWGSCRYNSATQFVGLAYDKLASADSYTDWATSQMNYMIGDNPSKRCYAVGYNENSSQYPHHRAASRSTDDGIIVENHYTLLGALVGGPGSNGTYKDAQDDYYCNEVALDYNAGYVGALAGLYLAHKNDDTVYLSYAGKNADNYSVSLSSEEELSEVGVTTYYGQGQTEEPEEPKEPANLTSSVENLVCAELEYGYDGTVAADAAITNTGQLSANVSSIVLENGNNFEIISPSAGTVILPSGTCKLQVRPKKGLAAGSYTDAVVIHYGEETLRIPVSVKVNKKQVSNVNFPVAGNLVLGQALSESVLTGGDTQYGTFAWANGSVVLAKGNTNCDVILTLNDSAKANYSFDTIEGYSSTGTITRSISVNVLRADLPIISFPSAGNIEYGQSLADSQLFGGSTEYGSFRWEDSGYKPSAAEMGTIQKYVIFTWSDACVSEYGLEENERTLKQAVSLIVEKAEQTQKPSTPLLLSRTAKSITVVKNIALEYSLDGNNWQTGHIFDALEEFTKYTVYVRYKETETHREGTACETPLVVYTLVEDPYKIDISKLAESNYEEYVDALRTSADSEPTVTFEGGVLTLTGENVTYTLTGNYEKLKVKVLSEKTKLIVSQGTELGEIEKPSEAPADEQDDEKQDEEPDYKIIVSGITKKVAPGKKLKLTAKLYPADVSSQKILWKVSNKKYASVSRTGVVKAKKSGKGKQVIVTAYLEKDNSVLAVYKISIMKKAVKKIKLSAKTTTVKVGRKIRIKAKFTPAKGISKEVTWTSTNPKVATVNAKGKVTAKKKGTAKIIARAKDGSGKRAVIKIRVK